MIRTSGKQLNTSFSCFDFYSNSPESSSSFFSPSCSFLSTADEKSNSLSIFFSTVSRTPSSPLSTKSMTLKKPRSLFPSSPRCCCCCCFSSSSFSSSSSPVFSSCFSFFYFFLFFFLFCFLVLSFFLFFFFFFFVFFFFFFFIVAVCE